MRFLREINNIVRYYSDVKSIARRMFVTNSFDGLLAAIGVNVGGYSPYSDPLQLAMGIIGGGVAMGVFSGMLGVYLSERAERLREVAELERKLAKSLKGSVYWKAARIIPLYIALWSGLGIVVFPTLTAIPYFLAARGLLGVSEAFYWSLLTALALMALLGAYLARISGESIVKSVARSVGVGLGGALLVLVLKSAFNLPLAG